MEVLDGMEAITQKKKQEAEEERMREAQRAMEAEVSLEDFLGLASKRPSFIPKPILKSSASGEMKKSSSGEMKKSPSLSILTKKIDLDSEISDVKLKLNSGVALGMKETFYICDRGRTGIISRECVFSLISHQSLLPQLFLLLSSDFESILMSQDLDVKDPAVSRAMVASGISVDTEMVSYEEYSKTIFRLESVLKNPQPKQDLKPIGDQVLTKLGAKDGKLHIKALRTVLEGSGKGTLSDTQLKRLLEQLPTDETGFIDLASLLSES